MEECLRLSILYETAPSKCNVSVKMQQGAVWRRRTVTGASGKAQVAEERKLTARTLIFLPETGPHALPRPRGLAADGGLERHGSHWVGGIGIWLPDPGEKGAGAEGAQHRCRFPLRPCASSVPPTWEGGLEPERLETWAETHTSEPRSRGEGCGAWHRMGALLPASDTPQAPSGGGRKSRGGSDCQGARSSPKKWTVDNDALFKGRGTWGELHRRSGTHRTALF